MNKNILHPAMWKYREWAHVHMSTGAEDKLSCAAAELHCLAQCSTMDSAEALQHGPFAFRGAETMLNFVAGNPVFPEMF